jgi:hypothetical protein
VPSEVSELGGAILRIEGAGFRNRRSLRCMFTHANSSTVRDGAKHFSPLSVPARWASESVALCAAPPLPPLATYDVALANNGVEAGTSAAALHVVPAATILAAFPRVIPAEGGALVVLRLRESVGAADDAAARAFVCRWGGVLTRPAIALNDSAVLCASPAASDVLPLPE